MTLFSKEIFVQSWLEMLSEYRILPKKKKKKKRHLTSPCHYYIKPSNLFEGLDIEWSLNILRLSSWHQKNGTSKLKVVTNSSKTKHDD